MTGRVRLSQILKVFGWIGFTSLGAGRSVYFHDALVVKRPWIKNNEFIQDLTLSQLLPGPNFSNLAVALGVRLAGWRGGASGAVALIVPGALILLAVSVLYFRIGFAPNDDVEVPRDRVFIDANLAAYNLYFGADDIAALAETLTARGIRLTKDVHETPWGTRELVIKDDQGHTRYFDQSP